MSCATYTHRNVCLIIVCVAKSLVCIKTGGYISICNVISDLALNGCGERGLPHISSSPAGTELLLSWCYTWMDHLAFLHPFQQYFSHIKESFSRK